MSAILSIIIGAAAKDTTRVVSAMFFYPRIGTTPQRIGIAGRQSGAPQPTPTLPSKMGSINSVADVIAPTLGAAPGKYSPLAPGGAAWPTALQSLDAHLWFNEYYADNNFNDNADSAVMVYRGGRDATALGENNKPHDMYFRDGGGLYRKSVTSQFPDKSQLRYQGLFSNGKHYLLESREYEGSVKLPVDWVLHSSTDGVTWTKEVELGYKIGGYNVFPRDTKPVVEGRGNVHVFMGTGPSYSSPLSGGTWVSTSTPLFFDVGTPSVLMSSSLKYYSNDGVTKIPFTPPDDQIHEVMRLSDGWIFKDSIGRMFTSSDMITFTRKSIKLPPP